MKIYRSILFFLMVIITQIAVGAVYHVTVDGLKYRLYDSGYGSYDAYLEGGNPGANMVIPREINYNNNKYRVSSISQSAFDGNKTLRSVTIPTSVHSIRENAFYGCSNLGSLTLHTSTSSAEIKIDEGAFKGCNLKQVDISPYCKFEQNNSFDPGVKINVLERQVREGCISIEDALSTVYNPSTKRNYKNKPLIIVTYMAKCGPTIKARKLIPPYLASNKPQVEFIFVDMEQSSESTDWINRMDIAATGQKKNSYASPIFYFVNTNGSASRFVGFSERYLKGSDNEAVEFRNLISNLR